MAGGWGSKKNGIRIGVFWDGIQISSDGSQARITDPRVAIDRDVNIVDSSNNLSWSGGAVTDGSDSNLNLDGSGEKRIKNVSGQWQGLSYGSTTTVSFSASLSGVNYAGGTLTASKSVTFPARAIDPPVAPTGLSATVNATTNTASISWTNNATTSAPYTSLKLERSSNGGVTWVDVPLSGTPTSFSDTGLVENSRYRYRISAVNASGSSAYTTMETDGYTTPNAPSSCTAAKDSSGNIVVSWLDNSAYETGFEVWHSSNGGSTWDAAPLTTQSAGTTSWTHVSPNTGTTHTYRIRSVLGALVSGYSAQSNTVQLLTQPLAPTPLGPSSGSALNTAISNTFSWRHNSADTTAQTAYELRHQYSTDGGTTWSAYTTVSGTTDQFRLFTAGSFTPNRRYRWNVRTKGQHPNFSDWSVDSTFFATTAPTATWVSPTNGGIVATATVTAQWTYSDAESEPQSRYRLILVDESGNTIETIDTASAATSQAMSTILQNNRTYVLRLQVWDSSGLASSIVSVTFQTSFPTPRPAVFGDVDWDTNTGSVSISWDNPDPAGSPAVELRRNINTVPRAAASWGATWGTDGAGTATVETDARWWSGVARKMVWSAANTVAATAYISTGNTVTVAVGQTYVISVRYAISGASFSPAPKFAGTNTPVFTYGAVTNVDNGDGTFTASRTATCTAAGAGGNLVAGILDLLPAMPVGAVYMMGDAFVEVATSFGGYFDGEYSPDPSLAAAWVGAANASQSTLSIPAVGPTPASVSNTLLRSEDGGVTWETVATGLANDSTVVDYGPKFDTEILYRIASVSAMNTVVTSDIESAIYTRNSGQWVFFNVGPAWATWAKVRISPEYDLDFERAKEVHQFAKRDDSVELIGRVRRRTMGFSAVIEPYVEQDAMDALLHIADQEAPIMYRDTRGRKWFVSIGPVKLSTKGLTTFSTQLTYVGRRNVG